MELVSAVKRLKSDCSLFSKLFISCQIRDGNLDNVFAHENQACSPSLSNMDTLRLGTKSDLVSCLEKLVPTSTDDNDAQLELNATETPNVDAVIVDGAVIVNMLKPGTSHTFVDYASEIFLPYITTQPQNVQRVDLVWDEYGHGRHTHAV